MNSIGLNPDYSRMADAEWLATAFRAALRKQAGDAPNSQAEAFNASHPLPNGRGSDGCSHFAANLHE